MYNKKKKIYYSAIMLMALSLAGVMMQKVSINAAMPKLQETEVTSYGAPDLTIANAREFSEFVNNVSNGNDYKGKLVVLSDDIKYDGVTTNNYSPAGSFAGVFDGMGHTISGIDVTGKDTASLFVSNYGVIKNVTVGNSSFQGSKSVSGLMGVNRGLIENCSVKGCKLNLISNYGKPVDLGGVAAKNFGTIRNCFTYGNSVTSNEYNHVGGIVGHNDGGQIYNCTNQADISSQGGCVGGVVGYVDSSYSRNDSTIENCYNIGKISVAWSSDNVGGIVGRAYGIVAHCYTSTSSCDRNFGYMGGTERDNKAYNEDEMKATSFLNLLNANRGSHTEWAKWEIRADSAYPLPAKAKDITKCSASPSTSSTVYNSEEQKPTVTVVDNGVKLVQDVDYTVTYPEDMTKPGVKTINIDSAGTYYGRIELSFTIEKADQSFTGKTSYSKAYNSAPFRLDAKREVGDGKITFSSSDEKIAKFNIDGSVRLVGIGTAVLTMRAEETEYYKPASIDITVKVKPIKVVQYSAYKKKGKINAYWSRDYKASGYQVQYSTDKKFKKNTKTITIKKSSKTSCKIKKIKRGRKYYVRVRAYKNGIYGSWSKTVKVK